MSTIKSSTTSTTAYSVVADTTGTLVFQTGATPTTAMTLGSDQSVTFAGTPTYTAGTANGVAYLNGSKVLTTGSALVFDGTHLGVGVTPSAWVGYKVMQAGIASFAGGSSGAYLLQDNAFTDNSGAGWKYINSGYAAAQYYAASGAHVWRTAASGTAGNAITFTQAMTLDASGNLLVGTTTSYGNRLSIVPSSTPTTAAGANALQIGESSSNTGYRLQLGYFNDPTNGFVSSIQSYGAGSPNNLVLQGAGGNLLVGTTSSNSKLQVTTVENQNVIDVRASSSTYAQTGVQVLIDRNTTNNSFYAIAYYNVNAGNYKFLVADSGNVTNTNNSYGAISDVKLKENIVDATPKLAELMQVKVRNYNLKSDPNHKQLGVIAQELESVFPAMIDESSDRDAKGNVLETTTKQVKYSVFVPMLIKAIQEQQALITQLQADVAQLKGTA
jgi:hypothetical protein